MHPAEGGLDHRCTRHLHTHACSVTQSCPTPCGPMDCSPPVSSVHGILQGRILEGIATPSSRGSSRPRDPGIKLASLLSPALVGGFFTISATWEALQAHNSTQSYMDWMLGNVQTRSDVKATAPVRTGALTNMLTEDTQGSLAEGVQKHPQSSPLFRMPEVVLKNYTKSPTACTPPSPPPAALRDSEGTKGLPMAQNR